MDADGNRSNTQNDGEKQDGHKAARFFLGWLVALNKGITKLLKKALGPDYIAVTEDEVLDMVNALAQTPDDDGDGENVIEESSAQMINNIFEFKDLTAGDVMTHRTNIVGVDMSVSLDDIIYLALDMGFSRIPVYEGSIDRIVGIIIVKDLLCLVGKSQADLDGFDIHDFVRGVNFVPESCPCSEVFKSLTSLKSGMAVVADEYGGTAGIVTLEDIIEAVMGNIQDEYDDERSEIVKVGEDEYDIDGEADPDEVFRLFGVELPEEHDYETIAGFITDKLGYIPEGDDERSEIVKVGEDEYDIDGEADPDEVFRLFGVELPEEHDYETIAGFITDKLGYIPEGDELNPPSVEYKGVKLVVIQVEDRCILKVHASRVPQTAEPELTPAEDKD